ncbi:MAG: UvrD-helicase domain-containing protein [Planctomycetia bacterium]|nr:UvrD-helicase domain-containing protein [Planctomycetia bacterium]
MLPETLLQKLTDAQREAVLHRDGPLLVVAGPGSGKTRVVTHRVAQLLSEGVAPSEILVLTFTNKAASEMMERVKQLTGYTSVWIGTFHRFCARLLRQYANRVGMDPNYTIYTTNDSVAAVRDAMARLKEMDAEKEGRFTDVKYSAESMMHALSAIKNRFLDPEREYVPEIGDERGEFLRELIPILTHQMRLANAVDFDDLLLLTVQLFRDAPDLRRRLSTQFRYILIDEYQDTNLAQYAISRALSFESRNLMAAGDPDQSIYGWRGANISNILEFEKDFPSARVIRLEENFRSTQLILNAAESLIEHNTQRRPKALFSRLGNGLPVRFRMDANETEEANRITREIADAIHSGARSADEFAIFYRMNALSVHFEKALRLRGVPFRILHGTEFFDRAEIRDLLAYFRLLANPHDQEAFLRIVNVPTRGIGKTSLTHLSRYAWENGFSLWEAAVRVENCPTLKPRAVSAIKAFTDLIQNLYDFYQHLQETYFLRTNTVQSHHATQNQNAEYSGTQNPTNAPSVLAALADELLMRTEYEAQFDPTDEQDMQRLRNVQEFRSLTAQFDAENGGNSENTKYSDHPESSENTVLSIPTLEAFLEKNALTSDTDLPTKDVFEGDSELENSWENRHGAVSLMTLHAAKGLEFPCVYLTGCEHGILPHERSQSDENQLEEERRLFFVGMTRAQQELNLSMAETRECAGKRRPNVPSSFLMELPREEMRMENFQPRLSFTNPPQTECLDESFGEAPEEIFEAQPQHTLTEKPPKHAQDSASKPLKKQSPTFFPDESEAFFEDDVLAEPMDFVIQDFSQLKRARRPHREKNPVPKSSQESVDTSRTQLSQSPRLKNIPNIPGLMTGADMLRQQKKTLDDEPF